MDWCKFQLAIDRDDRESRKKKIFMPPEREAAAP
jgi:hypothetical protein